MTRSVGDAEAFINGLKRGGASLLVTDPPWQLNGGSEFDKAAPYALVDTAKLAAQLNETRTRLVKGGHAYIFAPGAHQFAPILRGLVDGGWTFNGLICWDKTIGRGHGLGGTWRSAFEPVLRLSNGPPRKVKVDGMWPTLLRQRPAATRTSKPPQLYRCFVEASTVPGETVIDPWCGLNPLREACESARGGPRHWLSNDVLTEPEVQAQARRRT